MKTIDCRNCTKKTPEQNFFVNDGFCSRECKTTFASDKDKYDHPWSNKVDSRFSKKMDTWESAKSGIRHTFTKDDLKMLEERRKAKLKMLGFSE